MKYFFIALILVIVLFGILPGYLSGWQFCEPPISHCSK